MANSPSQPRKQTHFKHLADNEDILQVKREERDIKRLELPISTSSRDVTEAGESAAKDERIADLPFNCSKCGMHEMVHYYGKSPQFVQGLEFLEDTFVMRDPFQAPPPRWKTKPEHFIAIGSVCKECRRTVCKDIGCSLYYTGSYCLKCAQNLIKKLPVEAQVKLRKQLSVAEK